MNYKKPEKIFWWMNPICNLNCNHCNIGENTNLNKIKKESLNKNKRAIKRISKWLRKEFKLDFILGEPLLHKNLLKLIRYAKSKKGIISITTNGTLITKEKSIEIINSKLDSIYISLDSFNSKIHDFSRGIIGTRDKVFNGIKNLKETKEEYKSETPKIYINSIIMANNLDELIKLTYWIKKNRLDGITFQPIANPQFFGKNEKEYNEEWFKKSKLWPNNKKINLFLEQITQLKKEGYPIKNTLKDIDRFKRYFKDPIEYGIQEDNSQEYKSLILMQNGDLKLCPTDNLILGNVYNNKLKKIWNPEKVQKARKHIKMCKSQCKILANNN
jgi:MoaA/NifB/PqqE/SkfB family radical SAM enzyme